MGALKDYCLLALALVAILQSTYTLGAMRVDVAPRAPLPLPSQVSVRHVFHASLPETCVGAPTDSEVQACE